MTARRSPGAGLVGFLAGISHWVIARV